MPRGKRGFRVKFLFTTKPQHPFIEDPLAPPYSYTLRSRRQRNHHGQPRGIGKLVYSQSRARWMVLCYDRECASYFETLSRG